MTAPIKPGLAAAALLVLLAAALYLPGAGAFGLLDPDEPFYCLTAREMLRLGSWNTPILFGEPQFEKPVLFYWLLCLSFRVGGVTEAAARLVPALGGVLTVLATYLWGRALLGRRDAALASALILATAGQFVVQSRVVLTDIWLCLFVTCALGCLSALERAGRARSWAGTAFFFFCGLGCLTKGPLGLAIPLAAAGTYCILARDASLWRALPWKRGLLVFALTALPWYARMELEHGPGFLRHFFLHENVRRFFVAEHRGLDRAYFYPLGMLLGFFPWSFLVPGACARAFKRAASGDRRMLFLVATFVPTLLFFATAKSKLLSYVFPLFPVLALACGAWAVQLCRACRAGRRPSAAFRALAFVTLGLLPPGFMAGTVLYGSRVGLELAGTIGLIAAVSLPAFWTSLWLAWRGRIAGLFAWLTAAVLILSTTAFTFLLPASDRVFSSRQVTRIDAPLGSGGTFLLASKMYVRGVAYYTGNSNAGVLAEHPDKVFYTRHPIVFVSNADELADLVSRHEAVYGFLRPKDLRLLEAIADARVRVFVLRHEPERVFVRVDGGA